MIGDILTLAATGCRPLRLADDVSDTPPPRFARRRTGGGERGASGGGRDASGGLSGVEHGEPERRPGKACNGGGDQQQGEVGLVERE